MEQYVRDARINMIYEGTNGIQALDLLGRKVLSDGGATLKKFGELVRELIEKEGTDDAMAAFARAETLVGSHPAIDFARGEAYKRVFKNADAVTWFQKAAARADDDRIYRQLAISAGSVTSSRRSRPTGTSACRDSTARPISSTISADRCRRS